MELQNLVKSEITGSDLILSRIFDAPRTLVYKVWTQPSHIEKWFGPHSIRENRIESDLRKGGSYRFVMVNGDGAEYPMTGIYTEVIPGERISYTCNLDEHPKEWHEQLRQNMSDKSASIDSLVTILFEDVNDKTKVTIQTRFSSPDVRDAFANMGMTEGWTESLERFENELDQD